jgi:hypothetical protein
MKSAHHDVRRFLLSAAGAAALPVLGLACSASHGDARSAGDGPSAKVTAPRAKENATGDEPIEEVCAHVANAMMYEMSGATRFTEQERVDSEKTCSDELMDVKPRNPVLYKCYVRCQLQHTDMAGFAACKTACDSASPPTP